MPAGKMSKGEKIIMKTIVNIFCAVLLFMWQNYNLGWMFIFHTEHVTFIGLKPAVPFLSVYNLRKKIELKPLCFSVPPRGWKANPMWSWRQLCVVVQVMSDWQPNCLHRYGARIHALLSSFMLCISVLTSVAFVIIVCELSMIEVSQC